MIEIKDLLLRFQSTLLSEEIKKDVVLKTISRIIKFKIKKEDIEIKNGTVFLKIKSIYKNEIFLKKDLIFSEIKDVLGKRTPNDIR